MTGRRLKTATLIVGLALGALTLLTWTQVWFSVTLTTDQVLDVPGDSAAAALAALGLSTLALVGALAIAGPVFRVILGLLAVAIGGLVMASAIMALVDPVLASSAAISSATGLDGVETLHGLVAGVAASPWPIVALILGVSEVFFGLAVLLTSRRWSAASRRFQPVRFEPAEGSATPSEVWDALSDGRDPTSAHTEDEPTQDEPTSGDR